MNEARFRTLMREAVGEEPMRPWLTEAVRTRIAQPEPRSSHARWLVLIAACLAAVVVVAALAPRLLSRSTPPVVVPAASPSPLASPSPTPISAFNCTLPVHAGNTAGFVSTSTGAFTADPTASVGALPGGTGAPPSYDATVSRWLPVGSLQISPDGTAYAYVVEDEPGVYPSDLHIYDLRSGTDRKLWTSTGVGIIRWSADGIHVVTSSLPTNRELVINPDTGGATEIPTLSRFWVTPLPGDPMPGHFRTLGYTLDGHQIWWFYNLDVPGAVDWVFYETAPGVRVYVYKGRQGDATGFDPGDGFALADSTGLWFNEHAQRPLVWHWDADTGLRKIAVHVPGVNQPKRLWVVPAGACF